MFWCQRAMKPKEQVWNGHEIMAQADASSLLGGIYDSSLIDLYVK